MGSVFVSAGSLTGARTMQMPPDIVDGVMSEREVSVLVGQSGSGKSWMALELAYAVATGTPWLGIPTQRHPVVYVDLEITLAAFSNRMERIRERIGAPQDADIRVLSPEVCQGWTAEQIVDAIEDEHVRGSLIIIDCLYMLEQDDENSNNAMAWLLMTLKRLCIDGGNTLFIIHHTAKGASGQKSVVDSGAGAGAIGRFCNNRLRLLPLSDVPGGGAYRLDMVLRDHEGHDPMDLWYDGTCFRPDSDGELASYGVEGSAKARARKGAEMNAEKGREERQRKAEMVGKALADLEASGMRPTWRRVWGTYNSHAEAEGLQKVSEATFRDWLKAGRPFPYHIEDGEVRPDKNPS